MKDKKGFTLLELLICVALISVVIIFLFRLISLIRQDEKAVGYIRANQASRNQVMGEIGSIIAENAVCSFSTEGSNYNHGIITLNLCTNKTLVIEVEKPYIKINYNGSVSKYPMKDNRAWYNPAFTVTEGNYYGFDYHKIVIKTEKKGMNPTPIDDIEVFWVDRNGFPDDYDGVLHAQMTSGIEFNKRIRRLADTSLNCSDENMFSEAHYECFDYYIKSIEKSNTLDIEPSGENIISTDTSPNPIYAWFSNGTIKIYSVAPVITLNSDSSFMFSDLHAVSSIDLSYFDTSQVINMAGFFRRDVKLTSVDLSSFNTSNVTNMSYMFDMPGYGVVDEHSSMLNNITFGEDFDTSNVVTMRYMFTNNVSLQSLNLSSFDTSNVTDFTGMFANAFNLTSIDLSTFDFSKGVISSTSNLTIFTGNNSLQTVVTPKRMSTASGAKIPLPYLMNNTSEGISITEIDSTTPTCITLTKAS